MPSRKKMFSIVAVAATFAALAVAASTLNGLELTHREATSRIAQSVTDLQVAWLTDYDAALGVDTVVGAQLTAASGLIHSASTIAVTITGPGGHALGTISSIDGGVTWTGDDVPIPADDAVTASVVINDGATIAATTQQN